MVEEDGTHGRADTASNKGGMRTTTDAGEPQGEDDASDRFDQWLEEFQKPVATAAEIHAYLEAHGRSREALAAAGVLTRDDALLREAAKRFPEDPMVQFLVVANNLFPDDRREWVERFKQSQPDNALAAYYMAREHLAAGETSAAIAELRRGAGLEKFEDFSEESMLGMDAMMLEMGKSPFEAKSRSTSRIPLAYLGEFSKIADQLAAIQQEATTPGEAQELAAIGAAMGNDLSQGPAARSILTQVIGLGIEAQFLKLLDPETKSPYFSGDPATMLAEIETEMDNVRIRAGQLVERMGKLDEPMMSHYFDRVRISGEAAAIDWLKRTVETQDASTAD